MSIRFSGLIRPGQGIVRSRYAADIWVGIKDASTAMVFMSHKTGDKQAEMEAEYIAQAHGVQVYMAEWDDRIAGDSQELPDYIMNAIRESDGFLVSVIEEIRISMWIGYEIGGAHALQKSRARIMHNSVHSLPSVVAALESLWTRNALDLWIKRKVLSYRSG